MTVVHILSKFPSSAPVEAGAGYFHKSTPLARLLNVGTPDFSNSVLAHNCVRKIFALVEERNHRNQDPGRQRHCTK